MRRNEVKPSKRVCEVRTASAASDSKLLVVQMTILVLLFAPVTHAQSIGATNGIVGQGNGGCVSSGSAVLKGNGGGGCTNAVSGTDYAPATSGT